MKVALLIDSLESGGAERQALYALRELSRLGVDIRLIYYYQLSEMAHDLRAFDGARLVCLPRDGQPLRFLYRLVRYLREQHFDLLYAMKETPCIYGAIAAKAAGIRTMIAGHRTHTMPYGWVRAAFGLVKRVASGWIVNTHAVATALSEWIGIDKRFIEVIPNGIDPAEFRSELDPAAARRKLGLSTDCRVVTMIAAVRPEKNHAMFLRMASCVLQQMPDVLFYAVGAPRHDDHASLAKLRDFARELGIDRSVQFLGRRSDVADILAATDVSVLTSKFEGLSNTLLESYVCGVPVVTTNYPGVEEVVTNGHEGFITAQDDDVAMAERVQQLLRDEDLRRSMGQAGIQNVRTRFSMETMGRNLLEAFERYHGTKTQAACSIRS